MNGLGLWLGYIARVLNIPEIYTHPESKNLAIEAIRGAGGAIAFTYVGVASDMLVSSWQAAQGQGSALFLV